MEGPTKKGNIKYFQLFPFGNSMATGLFSFCPCMASSGDMVFILHLSLPAQRLILSAGINSYFHGFS